jgi:hypothetical protein
MTERENLLRVINGQEPGWVPRKGQLQHNEDPENHKPSCVALRPEVFPMKRNAKGGRIDVFGVEYEPTDSTGGQELPMPNRFILEDITKWRDIIKAPSLEGVDWRAIAEKALAGVDRNESCVQMGAGSNFFQQLCNFMGFTEGLVALAEEPEECMALFDYLCTYHGTIAKNLAGYIKPDILGVSDDNATAKYPFISLDMYQRLFVPFLSRITKIGSDLGLPMDMHDCGHCEIFVDEWVKLGINMWNPAQVTNDLVGIKKRLGNKMILTGCWDSQGPPGWHGAPEEVVRQAVRDCIDTYAPGGGFCFWASVYGALDDPRAKNHAFWVTDEYNKYGRTFYKRQG